MVAGVFFFNVYSLQSTPAFLSHHSYILGLRGWLEQDSDLGPTVTGLNWPCFTLYF